MADCIERLIAEVKGDLSPDEVFQIAARIRKEYKLIEIEDQEQPFKRRSHEERLQESTRRAYKKSLEEKKENLREAYGETDRLIWFDEYLKDVGGRKNEKEEPLGRVNALTRLLVGDVRGRQEDVTLEGRINGILKIDAARMYEALDQYASMSGYKLTKEQALNVIREYDKPGSTGDEAAKVLAETWKQYAEEVRERLNKLGANIGHLEDYRFPQIWDARLIKTAGLDTSERIKLLNPFISYERRMALLEKAKENWVDDAMQNIDRRRYFNEETGDLLTDDEMRNYLREAWDTISTKGLYKPAGGYQRRWRGESLAERLSHERKLHFKNADSWFVMADKYGAGDMFQLITNSIRKNAKYTAMMEMFRRNPSKMFYTVLNKAIRMDKSDKGAWRAQLYFEELNGSYDVPVSETGAVFANFMLGVRQWIVGSKLGGMLLSQTNDLATYAAIARSDGLGVGDALRFAAKSLNPANAGDRKLAGRMGIASQGIINDVALRYGEGVKGAKLSSRFANATIRLSGGEWWTNSMKRGYEMVIGFYMNDAIKNGLDAQEPMLRDMLRRYGIGEKEWEIIRQAKPVEISGDSIITPVAVKLLADAPEIKGDQVKTKMIRQTAIKVAAMMSEEADIAIVSPGARERALIKAGTRPGTIPGELLRSFVLFKTFTISLTTKVLPRIFNHAEGPDGFRAAYAVKFALAMIIAGGVSYQMKLLSKGINPMEMFDKDGCPSTKFWVAAAAQSGGLGIFGDFLFADYNRFGGGLASTIGGPVAALGEDFAKLTLGNIQQELQGKDTNFGAEAIQFTKSNSPLINLWYTRAALDHLLFYTVQEAANPGYLRRMRKRAEKEGRSYWWNPQDRLPEEAPDIKQMIGRR